MPGSFPETFYNLVLFEVDDGGRARGSWNLPQRGHLGRQMEIWQQVELWGTGTAIAETGRKDCNREADRYDLQRSEKNVTHGMVSIPWGFGIHTLKHWLRIPEFTHGRNASAGGNPYWWPGRTCLILPKDVNYYWSCNINHPKRQILPQRIPCHPHFRSDLSNFIEEIANHCRLRHYQRTHIWYLDKHQYFAVPETPHKNILRGKLRVALGENASKILKTLSQYFIFSPV